MRSLKKSVQQVLRKKVDVKNATPDVAETPPNQVRPSVWRVFWNVSVVRSNWTGLSERLPSIDEDVSSGAVVSGNPENKSKSTVVSVYLKVENTRFCILWLWHAFIIQTWVSQLLYLQYPSGIRLVARTNCVVVLQLCSTIRHPAPDYVTTTPSTCATSRAET